MHHAYTPHHDTERHVPLVDRREAELLLATIPHDVAEQAIERIRENAGPGQDPAVAAAFWLELSAWPEWAQWRPEPRLAPTVLERRDLA